MKKYLGTFVVGAIVALGAGCGSSTNGGGNTGGTAGTGGNAGTGGTGGSTMAFCEGKGVDFCAVNGSNGLAEITSAKQEITEDTCFSAACDYLITPETYVIGATMYVEAGAQFFGKGGSALIVTTTGKIEAVGTVDAPIVFGSAAADGQRKTGDWGGVVLLGKAKLSWGGTVCDGQAGECTQNIEGLPPTEGRGVFGGNDDTHDCGTLKYVRIEYAGFTFGPDNELNGLTVGGCGDQTTLSYIQIHRGLDDGVEFFGGTANADHFVVSGPGDDCFDWDEGYRGTITNFIGDHFNPSSSDPRGIEADNYKNNNDVEPRSAPELQYGTLIGSPTAESGIVNRRGTWGVQSGLVVVNFPSAGYDYRDGGWDVAGGWGDALLVDNTCFWNNDPNYPVDDPSNCADPIVSDCNDNNGSGVYFHENDVLVDSALNNAEIDPMLGDVSGSSTGGSPDYSIGNPACKGAFAPDGVDWTQGWTSYPVE